MEYDLEQPILFKLVDIISSIVLDKEKRSGITLSYKNELYDLSELNINRNFYDIVLEKLDNNMHYIEIDEAIYDLTGDIVADENEVIYVKYIDVNIIRILIKCVDWIIKSNSDFTELFYNNPFKSDSSSLAETNIKYDSLEEMLFNEFYNIINTNYIVALTEEIYKFLSNSEVLTILNNDKSNFYLSYSFKNDLITIKVYNHIKIERFNELERG